MKTKPEPALSKKETVMQWTVLSLATVFLALMFIPWTLIPYGRMYGYFSNIANAFRNPNSYILDPNASLYKENFLQLSVRTSLIELVALEYRKGEVTGPNPLLPFAITQMEQELPRHPFCVACYVDLGKAYDLLSTIDTGNADALLHKAEGAYTKGLALMPEYQAVINAYAVNLINQGRSDEAIQLMRTSMAADGRSATEHYYFGLVLYKAGPAHITEALAELEKGVVAADAADTVMVKKIYDAMLRHFYATGDAQDFRTVAERLMILDPKQASTYTQILDYVDAHGVLPVISFANSNE